MTIYYILYASMFFVAGISRGVTNSVEKQKKIICIYCFVVLFFLLALRHWCMGIDLGYGSVYNTGYIQSFHRLVKYSWEEIIFLESYLNYEKGYIVFNKLIGSMHQNKQFFLGCCAFINFLPVVWIINKKSKLPLLSWFIFLGLPVFLIFFSGLRQGIAIAIIVYSIRWIEEENKRNFIINVLIATTFHKTSIIFLAAYPIYYLKPTDLQRLLSLLAVPAVYLFRVPLFNIASKLFKGNAKVEDTGAMMLFIIFFLVYIFMIYFADRNDTKTNGYINLYYIACICQAFGSVYNSAQRVGYYFMIYLIVALPNVLANLKNNALSNQKEFRLFYFIIAIAFIWFGLHSLENATWARTNPYVFYWQTPQ